jgi:phi13 family phage major tail protein
MTYVGFKRLTIQPFAANGDLLCDPIVVEGKKDKGGTVSAEISGLSKDATKVSASNIAYYISRKGVGDVSVDFGILDLPEDSVDIIMGYFKPEKIAYIGENTEAPYCAAVLESENMQGEKSIMGFFSGSFTREKITVNTLDVTKSFEPEADSFTYSAMATDHDGDQNGQVVAKYAGTDTTVIEELKTQVLNPDDKTFTPEPAV